MYHIPNGYSRAYCLRTMERRMDAARRCERLADDPRNGYRRSLLLEGARDWHARAAAWKRAADDGRR